MRIWNNTYFCLTVNKIYKILNQSYSNHRSIKDHSIYNSDTIEIINCTPYVLRFVNYYQNQALAQVAEKLREKEKEIAETSTRLDELSKIPKKPKTVDTNPNAEPMSQTQDSCHELLNNELIDR